MDIDPAARGVPTVSEPFPDPATLAEEILSSVGVDSNNGPALAGALVGATLCTLGGQVEAIPVCLVGGAAVGEGIANAYAWVDGQVREQLTGHGLLVSGASLDGMAAGARLCSAVPALQLWSPACAVAGAGIGAALGEALGQTLDDPERGLLELDRSAMAKAGVDATIATGVGMAMPIPNVATVTRESAIKLMLGRASGEVVVNRTVAGLSTAASTGSPTAALHEATNVEAMLVDVVLGEGGHGVSKAFRAAGQLHPRTLEALEAPASVPVQAHTASVAAGLGLPPRAETVSLTMTRDLFPKKLALLRLDEGTVRVYNPPLTPDALLVYEGTLNYAVVADAQAPSGVRTVFMKPGHHGILYVDDQGRPIRQDNPDVPGTQTYAQVLLMIGVEDPFKPSNASGCSVPLNHGDLGNFRFDAEGRPLGPQMGEHSAQFFGAGEVRVSRGRVEAFNSKAGHVMSDLESPEHAERLKVVEWGFRNAQLELGESAYSKSTQFDPDSSEWIPWIPLNMK